MPAAISPQPATTYQVFPQYTGADSGCTNAVFLVPPAPFTYNQQIQFQVSYIYTGDQNYGNYSYPNSISGPNPDFQFAFAPAGRPAPPQPPYQATVNAVITIASNNVWDCAPAARAALMANFSAFIAAIEQQFELNATPVLIPGAMAMIAQMIAEIIPAPLTETLWYRYGFNPGFGTAAPCVDLQPGMRLRIEFASSQFVSPSSPFNAYTGGSQASYSLVSVAGPNGRRLLAFDPFLGSIAGPVIAPSGSAPTPITGIVDLQSSSMRHAHYRLVYPQNMIAGNVPGDADQAKNVTLFGADSLSDLNNAVNGTIAPGVSVSVIRGRATLVPEILVWVSLLYVPGSSAAPMPVYVPVGTTVMNIVERFTTWRPFGNGALPLLLSRLRTTTAGTTAPSGQFETPGYTQVAFGVPQVNGRPGQLFDTRVLDLPLVSGDTLNILFQPTGSPSSAR